LQFHYIWIL